MQGRKKGKNSRNRDSRNKCSQRRKGLGGIPVLPTRILCTVLACMMLMLLFCGCQWTEQGTNRETTALKKISFMAIGLNDQKILEGKDAEKVIQKYEEYTGIHVDWQWKDTGSYDVSLKYALMDSASIPMIVTVGGNMRKLIASEAKKGKFWDLAPFLEREDLFPNLSQANPQILENLKVDGQLIGIYRGRPVGRYGFSYRKDWAEAVGITEDPKTVEDVYELLYRFTYDDPDGNGVQDTYGLEMSSYMGSFAIMQTWFGCGNEWVEKNGGLVPVHETEEYLEALSWFRKIYEEGLIRPDWALVDAGAFGDGMKSGEAGVIVDVMGYGFRAWRYFREKKIPSVVNEKEYASMRLLGPIAGKTLSTDGYNGFFVITKDGAKTEEDVINCLTFLDKMCDDEMLCLVDHGLEGIGWEYDENGKIVDIWEGEGEDRPEYGLSQAICYIPNSSIPKELYYQDDMAIEQNNAYEKNEEAAVYNPALGYLASSAIYAEKGVELSQLLDDAKIAYICGEIDEEQLKERLQEWEGAGGEALKQEVNTLYRANHGE